MLDPESRTLVVHTPDGLARLHGPGDTVEGGAALPGFSTVVASLFPDDAG